MSGYEAASNGEALSFAFENTKPAAVQKRDGTTVQDFQPKKIFSAIKGAWTECKLEFDELKIMGIVKQVITALSNKETVTVETIQDTVEDCLMKAEYRNVAKAYIIYRQERQEEREANRRLLELKSRKTTAPLSMCNMLTPRTFYKPFEYPQYFEFFTKQNQAHWLPTEVPMENDIIDFKKNLSDPERALIVCVLRFFTQSDIEVNNNYNTRLISAFPKPEIKMMLSAFAQMEAVHVWAYSYLNDSLGLPDKEYSAFMDYEAMRAKYNYIRAFDVMSPQDLALNLAVFGGFVEGVSLFSSFAILMNFQRLGKLKGVGQIVSWSIRDESLHSRAICQLFRDFVGENKAIWTKEFRQTLLSACRDMVALEDAFVDTCFREGAVPGLTADQVKQYIRYTADRKLNELGLDTIYNVDNPLKWLDILVNGKEHTNFFENRSTDYAKGGVLDDWE